MKSEDNVELLAGPIEQKGKMFVTVNGEQIYSKGGFNAENPQPTPPEIADLIERLTSYAGKPDKLSAEETAEIEGLHQEQKDKMAAKAAGKGKAPP
mmetsp:Transcript_142870/g.356037  ORF Transcript_142870/g.356037 Transcript_142870/m.356037 type:complete len:96 (+) Transcript_142870:92-379(+)